MQGIVIGLQTIAVAVVTNLGVEYATALNSSIVVAGGAIIECCGFFVKENVEK